MSLLFDEYKLLQDKIDRIGSFRVTIKGWAVTAWTAVVVAVSTSKGFSPKTGAEAIDTLLLFFFILEASQVRYEWRYSNRVRLIEAEFDKRRRSSGRSNAFSTPNIARSLFPSNKKRARPRKSKTVNWLRVQFRLGWGANIFFYFVLGSIAWIPNRFAVNAQPPQQPTTENIIYGTMGSPAPYPATSNSENKIHSKRKDRK